MMGVFAEFERSMIRDRVRAELVRARAQGKRLGWPPIDGDRVERARTALTLGASLRDAAKAGGISFAVARRLAGARARPEKQDTVD